MCDAVSAGYAVFALLAIAGTATAVQQSNVQTRVYENNKRAAIKSAIDSYDAVGAKANQEREASGQSATQNAINAARARATASTAAQSSNLSGLSIDQIMGDIDRQESSNYQNIATNAEWAADQRVRQGGALTSEANGRINAVQPGNYDPVLGLLQIGAQTYAGYMKTTA